MNSSLKSVCLKNNINFSSAKNVIQIYKKEGRLEKKVQRTRRVKLNSESKDHDIAMSSGQYSEEIKSEGPPARYDLQRSCPVLLHLQDDDTFKLVPF